MFSVQSRIMQVKGSRGYEEEKEETKEEDDKKLEQEEKGHRLPEAQ